MHSYTRYLGSLLVVLALMSGIAFADANPYALPLTVTSELPYPRVPMDPEIDFGQLAEDADLPGVLDPASIEVINVKTGDIVPHAIEGFDQGDRGRVEWVITNPAHREYEIRFAMVSKRPPPEANTDYIPPIGVGDLLRYNAGEGRPFAITRSMAGLMDMNGDGKRDLVGTWSYAHRPGDPWNGVVFWPRVGSVDEFRFADMVRCPKLPSEYYTALHVKDVNHDGLTDLVYAKVFYGDDTSRASVFLNTGRRDAISGIWEFEEPEQICTPSVQWHPIRAVKLTGDDAVDVVLVDGGRYKASSSNYLMENTSSDGWPMDLAEPVPVEIEGYKATFFDVDRDGLLDAVSLITSDQPEGLSDYYVGWQKNLGESTPRFGPVRDLPAINEHIWRPFDIVAVNDGPRRGLLVVYAGRQRTAFLEPDPEADGPPYLTRFSEALCESAVLSLDDQSKPCVCDWDGDGDWDLLVGGGYGWPRIVINEGTTERPVFAEARRLESEGEPIRILREQVLGTPGHGHNMGYVYPSYADWDADGLPDLMLPNETNRIFWYKNIGSRAAPRFGPRRQVICDGYPDSPERRNATRLLTIDPDLSCYPSDENSPFPWRAAAGFVDWNDDGLMDMVTCFGRGGPATLFTQYRDENGTLHLRRDRELNTTDGEIMPASGYAPVDWDDDGDWDIVTSHSTSNRDTDILRLARNVGTNAKPSFEVEPLRCFGEKQYITRHGPKADAADIDGDGLPDVIASVEWSVYPFYSHAALMMSDRPEYDLGPIRQVQ